jgi:hypothetical protein
MEITFSADRIPAVEKIISLYRDAGLPRPIDFSVSTAMEYYPKVCFSKEDRGFIINRKK